MKTVPIVVGGRAFSEAELKAMVTERPTAIAPHAVIRIDGVAYTEAELLELLAKQTRHRDEGPTPHWVASALRDVARRAAAKQAA